MSNRFTGDNIRLIYDTLNFSKVQKQRGLLLWIDFEKAFDLLTLILKSFNFKKDITCWIKTFCNGIKSTVIVNNKPTPWFFVERGSRQCDPISPYIFFIVCRDLDPHD